VLPLLSGASLLRREPVEGPLLVHDWGPSGRLACRKDRAMRKLTPLQVLLWAIVIAVAAIAAILMWCVIPYTLLWLIVR
jgi:hypothetical protein